jgi:hypothetical protein
VPLSEYDVKSCTPVILLGLTKNNPDEKAKLENLLAEDIYTTIAVEQGVTKDRDDIKEDFMIFVNGAIKNYIFQYFQTHLPILTELIMRQKKAEKGLAWFGQSAESRIMVQEVTRVLMDSGNSRGVLTPSNSTNNNLSNSPLTCGGNPGDLLYIPMHDGWLGIERDEFVIAGAVRERFYKRFNYWVTITKTPVATGKKAILLEGRPPVAVEPVTIHR